MPVATLSNIEKTFGKRVLFDRLDFLIDRGERVGLIGDNGAGKTTLFKMFTGEVTPDAGTVAIARSAKLGHLAQDATFNPGNTVMDEAELAFAELHQLSHRMRELEHSMAAQQGDRLQRTLQQYESVQHEFDLAGGYAWRHRLEATLTGIGLLRAVWGQNVETLSGGQRSRLALAKLLIGEPDLLLLDEPTNHLDLAAIEWLERYLLNFPGAVLLISHDRYLLDRLATRIVWLTQMKLRSYPGNYSAFVSQRELAELSQARAHEEQQEQIEKTQEYIRRFGAGQRSRQAKGRKRRLDRLLSSDAMVQSVQRRQSIGLRVTTDQRAGDLVLRVTELSKSFPPAGALWRDVQFTINRGDRVGIIGPNGSGKTTLLRTLMGEHDADAGEVRWGANLAVGYYDQRLDEFDPEATVMEEARGQRDVKDQPLREVLGALLFRGDDIYKPMGLLSGGERARVALAQLLLDKPNVLLLDEPTNHLDIASREALELALGGFAGTILCVSHDRYFLQKTVKRLLVLQPPVIVAYDGGYAQWVSRMEADAARTAPRRVAPAERPQPTPRRNAANPYLRPFGRLSVAQLEEQITQTEIELAECQQQFGDSESMRDAASVKDLQSQFEALSKKLVQLEEEYYSREP